MQGDIISDFATPGHYCKDYHMNSWNLTGTRHLWIAFLELSTENIPKIASRHFEASTTSNDWKGSSRIFLFAMHAVARRNEGQSWCIPYWPCTTTVPGAVSMNGPRRCRCYRWKGCSNCWKSCGRWILTKTCGQLCTLQEFPGAELRRKPKWWRYDGCMMKSS